MPHLHGDASQQFPSIGTLPIQHWLLDGLQAPILCKTRFIKIKNQNQLINDYNIVDADS